MRPIQGIHHVTAIAGSAQENLDFYTGRLGLRLVKRTVNFDEPGTYHFYFGDHHGAPGSIMTFFPFADSGPGRPGPGMASAVAFALPNDGLDVWMEQLAADAEDFEGPLRVFDESFVRIQDNDGLYVELVEADDAPKRDDASILGTAGVTLCLGEIGPTARLFEEVFGYTRIGSNANGGVRLRAAQPGPLGSIVDLETPTEPTRGRPGAGTIHHVAFRVADDAEQAAWRERLVAEGLKVTPVIDRQYFRSIYFREPCGVLFEIATDPPGFTVDEDLDALGSSLKLPPQYEPMRAGIERRLPPVSVPTRSAP